MVDKKHNGKNKEARLPVMELFGPTIQGEGLMTGTVTHFLRTGGCGLRCEWCDSMFAVDPKLIKQYRSMMTISDILKTLGGMPWAPYLTLTGGDPCLHKALGQLIIPMNSLGTRVAVETQGELFPDWLQDCDVVTFSPKGPSSGNTVDPHDLIEWCIQQGPQGRRNKHICIKIVCFDEDDFWYAHQVYEQIPSPYYDAFYFTAGTPITDMADERLMGVIMNQQGLAETILDCIRSSKIRLNEKTHLGCQQHVLLWPGEEKGV